MDKLKKEFFDIKKLDNTFVIMDRKVQRDTVLLDVLSSQIKQLKEYFKDPIMKEDKDILNIKIGADLVLNELMKTIRLREL